MMELSRPLPVRRVLIVDRAAPFLSESLNAHGFSCQTQTDITYDGFAQMPDDIEGLVIRSRFIVDKPLIDCKKNLKFIVRLGSGMENIDVDYAQKHHICCLSTPEGNANAVAEHALGLLLSALKNIPKADAEVRRGEWLREANKGYEIASQTVGIIGYGNTGPAFARILHSFGCEIYVYDKFKTNLPDSFVQETNIETLLNKCNVISLHINYLPENKYFVGDNFLSSMQQGAILLNTSRGNVIDTSALVHHLKTGKIRYACLDVLEYENVNLKNTSISEWQLPMKELAQMNQVILTPHIAGQTFEAEQRHAEIAVNKILNLYK